MAEELSDERILEIAAKILGYEHIRLGEYEPDGGAVEAYGSELITFAKAILTEYGWSSIKPVTLKERLPERKDCDSEGRCWFNSPAFTCIDYHLHGEEKTTCPSWLLEAYQPSFEPERKWLPYWTFPPP